MNMPAFVEVRALDINLAGPDPHAGCPMFKKLLIANRGEVAVRVARAAHELGVHVVGITSEPDRNASWLAFMDEVVPIGGASPRESYLRAESVLQAARQTGCSAIHPGWGFLAEDARFAALCEQHGVTFIGPSAAVMDRMGLKWPAKCAMRAAGLDGIPGSEGLLEDVEQAVSAGNQVGYPVLLKADAGGGGRGMRLCHSEAELRDAFPEATAEALANFGNAGIYLERYLSGGRHVEIQILCDAFGGALHLGERECSIQRKHQKLLEESPSPIVDADLRSELGQRAANAASAIGYVGAGTMEFLRSDEGKYYFMEMNTRLQVEHPVSEMVTGVDIVTEQLRIAANGRLGQTQESIRMQGHAIECRINAEDPEQDFRPTPGTLARLEIPTDAGPGKVRVETHLQAGDEVSPYYDSLLAKIIVHGQDRAAAIETMEATLARVRIEGVSTTIPVHLAVLASPEFRTGAYDTRSIPGWGS
ncbi:MAG: acetyl-CoA carboxylase biotin carboxylase subunit [Chlamydiales bacterium]|jgi:acetyl-CoA carboxylase biotin carboxylase subunit